MKTSEKLGSFTVDEENVRKLQSEFEGEDVCYRTVTDKDTGDVLEREWYVRGMPLSVAESTLICPRGISPRLFIFVSVDMNKYKSRERDKHRVARYRRAAAKLTYLALDNLCVAYASKEVSRKMSDPEPSDDKSIIRVLRYLKQSGMVEYLYKWQDSPNEIHVYTDGDWSGRQKTRRSTTGGAVKYGSCLVAHWSRTQVSVALSSAEAEMNASVEAACEAIGMKQLCGHLGMPVIIKMFGDSSSMKGTLSRKGSGKVKHLETRQLWLQEHAASGNVVLVKVHRDLNLADALAHF